MKHFVITVIFAAFCQGQSYFFGNIHQDQLNSSGTQGNLTVDQMRNTTHIENQLQTNDSTSDVDVDYEMEDDTGDFSFDNDIGFENFTDFTIENVTNKGQLKINSSPSDNQSNQLPTDSDKAIEYNIENDTEDLLLRSDVGIDTLGNSTDFRSGENTTTKIPTKEDQEKIEDAIYVDEPETLDFSDLGINVTSGKFHIKNSRNNSDIDNATGIHKKTKTLLPIQDKQNIFQNNTKTSDKDLELQLMTGTEKELEELSREINAILHDHEEPYGEKIRKKIRFPRSYHTTGTLSLPFDGIIEPFEVWFGGGQYNMSRIDYYHGMDKTFQRGDLLDYGVMVKVIPVHYGKNNDLDKNTISCWYRPGFRWNPIRGQNVLPTNLKGFKFVGEEVRSGMPVLKYVRTTTTFNKNNTYTFYITKDKPHRPMRYVMHGIDTLLHSFYDHYVLDYLTFHPWKFDFDVMKIPKGNYCERKLRENDSKLFFNPMAEFMHENFDDVDVEQLYQHYKEKHNKTMLDGKEHETRKHIFRHNMRFIRSHNRAGLNYTLDSNELADLTDQEFDEYKGLLIDPSGGDDKLKKQIIPEVRFSIPHRPPPRNLDWREYGAVTPPAAQGHCGSCWTFSAMGAIEGAYAVKTGKLQDFSEQQLLDCSWGFGNYGCRGGFSWRALVWAKKFGVTTSESYGRYLAQEGYCHCAKKDNCARTEFARVMTVPKLNEEALRLGLAWYGPASIAINVNRKSFKFYSSGVLDDPKCAPGTNHGVVAVGYGIEKGKPFWLVKNSWGKLWGDEGFIKVYRRNNTCGVLTNEPIFVKFDNSVHRKQFPFLRMNKTTAVKKKKLNPMQYRLSPFEYKRSNVDLWTPPNSIKDKEAEK